MGTEAMMPQLDPRLGDLEAPIPDALEEAEPVDPVEAPEDVHVPIEANEADAVEQALPAGPAPVTSDIRVPLEANEADAIEQSQPVIELDDDYR